MIDWEKLGTFVQVVGVPFAILLLFVGPFIYLIFGLVKKYGARIAESHLNFMESASVTQEKNAETLAKLEDVVAKKHIDHVATHHAIYLMASAGISFLDSDHAAARIKLTQIGRVLPEQNDRDTA
jgi:hypothetical protein